MMQQKLIDATLCGRSTESRLAQSNRRSAGGPITHSESCVDTLCEWQASAARNRCLRLRSTRLDSNRRPIQQNSERSAGNCVMPLAKRVQQVERVHWLSKLNNSLTMADNKEPYCWDWKLVWALCSFCVQIRAARSKFLAVSVLVCVSASASAKGSSKHPIAVVKATSFEAPRFNRSLSY